MMTMREFDKKQIYHFYWEAEWTQKEIADYYGVSTSTIQRYFKKTGIRSMRAGFYTLEQKRLEKERWQNEQEASQEL